MSDKSHMNDSWESSSDVVPLKRWNKGRGRAEGNRGGKVAGQGEHGRA